MMEESKIDRSWGKPATPSREDEFDPQIEDSGCCVALAILAVVANNFMLFTIPYTLMPQLAEDRGVSSAIVGVIFAVWGMPSLFNSFYPNFERCCRTK